MPACIFVALYARTTQPPRPRGSRQLFLCTLYACCALAARVFLSKRVTARDARSCTTQSGVRRTPLSAPTRGARARLTRKLHLTSAPHSSSIVLHVAHAIWPEQRSGGKTDCIARASRPASAHVTCVLLTYFSHLMARRPSVCVLRPQLRIQTTVRSYQCASRIIVDPALRSGITLALYVCLADDLYLSIRPALPCFSSTQARNWLQGYRAQRRGDDTANAEC